MLMQTAMHAIQEDIIQNYKQYGAQSLITQALFFCISL